MYASHLWLLFLFVVCVSYLLSYLIHESSPCRVTERVWFGIVSWNFCILHVYQNCIGFRVTDVCGIHFVSYGKIHSCCIVCPHIWAIDRTHNWQCCSVHDGCGNRLFPVICLHYDMLLSILQPTSQTM